MPFGPRFLARYQPIPVMIAAIRLLSLVASLSTFSKSSADLATCRIVVWLDAAEEVRDQLFPRIAFVAFRLFGLGMIALEFGGRPPRRALAVERDRFGEQLIAVTLQRRDVNVASLDRPEAAATGFVAQIGVLVGRSDKNALPWLDHLQTPVRTAGSVRSCG